MVHFLPFPLVPSSLATQRLGTTEYHYLLSRYRRSPTGPKNPVFFDHLEESYTN